MPVPVVLGVVGAAVLGGGFVAQQREAARVHAREGLSVTLVLSLIRRRVWWTGVAAMATGYVLVGWSLGSGNLVLVEPLIAANLPFALLVAAAWQRERPSSRSLLGALALAAGVSGFVLVGDPHGGRSTRIAPHVWVWSAAGVGAVVAVLVVLALRRRGSSRATLLGAATGCLYGLQDAVTRRVYGEIGRGLVETLTTWPVWTLLVVGALGVLLAQNAFDGAPLTSSLPAISGAEPVTGIALGIAVFDSRLRTSALALVAEAVCLAVMIAGVLVVARSPVVARATASEEEPLRPAA